MFKVRDTDILCVFELPGPLKSFLSSDPQLEEGNAPQEIEGD